MFKSRFLSILKISAFTVLLLVKSSVVYADVDVTKYPLGISPKTLHDLLVNDNFVFKKFTGSAIQAIKKVAVPIKPGSEISDVIESTTLTAKLCAGKMYEIQMTSVYTGDRTALLMGRKNLYKYLKENNAINDGISLHKNETNPRVVLSYSIDRNSQADRNIRGTEVIKVALDTSTRITIENIPLLQMTYQLKNKWFCPN